MNNKYLLEPGAELHEYNDILTPAICLDVSGLLLKIRQKPRLQFTLFKKICTMRRQQMMFGANYKFSGIMVNAEPEPDPLVDACIAEANRLYPQYNFNAALVNLYETGDDYISPHSDNESKLKPGAPIVAFSFGATRKMHFVKKATKDKFTVDLRHNQCVAMVGENFQKKYTHAINREKKVDSWRMSITVRQF